MTEIPEITYIAPDGAKTVVAAEDGDTVMHAAVRNDVAGIVGECGGNAMCATCHVYVDTGYLDRLTPVEDSEDELLEEVVSPRAENSRLGCQITVGPEQDGLIVRLPEAQV